MNKTANAAQKEIKKISWTRESIRLVNRYLGVLFFYLVFFDLFKTQVLDRIIDKVVSLAMLTSQDGYVALDNAIVILKNPLVLLALLLRVWVFCFICLLKNAGIMICMESFYQEKPVHFHQILPCSLEQIKHTIKPKNWQIFIYIIVIQPLIDADLSSSRSALSVPGFIMDVIQAKAVLLALYVAVMLVALVFFWRYLFLQQYYILRKEDFKQAARDSVSMEKKEKLTIGLKLIALSWLAWILYVGIPAVFLLGGDLGLFHLLKDFSHASEINRMVLNYLGYPLLKSIGRICVNLLITSYIIVVFHETEKNLGIYTPIELPEKLIKTQGRIYNFRLLRRIIIAAEIVLTLASFAVLTVGYSEAPEIVDALIATKKVIAHKGYSSLAPENTRSAFELAVESNNADYIELDVRETKDGVPVVIHNETITDATHGKDKRSIYSINYEELASINACYGFGDEYPEERISSLEDILKEFGNKKKLIIEIKMDKRTPDLPKKIVDLIHKYNCKENCMIHSGNYKALEAAKKEDPEIPCGYIITLAVGGFYDLPAADFFTLECDLASNKVIEAIHARNKKVYVWTINSESSMQQMLNRQVDGVITDYPDRAAEVVNGSKNEIVDLVFNNWLKEFAIPGDLELELDVDDGTGEINP